MRRFDYQRMARYFRAAERDRSRARLTELEDNKFLMEFRQGLRGGEIDPHSLRIRPLFEHFVPNGHEVVSSWHPSNQGGSSYVMLSEAGVNTAAFANITGQVVYSAVMQEFENPNLLAGRVAKTIPTEFDGEKIPNITNLGDVAESIGEGKPYPEAGVGEAWIETPSTTKRGFIVPLTKEAVFFDRTHLLVGKAAAVAEAMAVNKEKRVLDTVLGVDTSYRRNGGAAQATYADSHSNGDFDNLVASNGLSDWTDIENAELAFDAISDPDSGEPVNVVPRQLVVPTALKHTARRILNATEVREVSNTNTTTLSDNPLDTYEILTNQYVKNRTGSATTWFIGDFQRAFAYMENWPAQTSQSPSNSHDEFHRDVVMQWKITERGAPAVIEPRFAVKCTA